MAGSNIMEGTVTLFAGTVNPDECWNIQYMCVWLTTFILLLFYLLESVDVELKAAYTCTVYMETWAEISLRKPVLHAGSTVHVYWKLNFVYLTRAPHDRNDQVVHNLAIWIV